MIAISLGDAKGMTKIAEKAGLGRESLYKSLSLEGNPRFSTVLKVVDALGFRHYIKPKAKRTGQSEVSAIRHEIGEG